jgi:adenylate cyclase
MSGTKASDTTGNPQDRRKLVAVMYADMVGYSRLIGLDDTGTLRRLRRLRRDLIDPAIEEHGGRIVQTGGDSLLVVFDSVDGAARCAVKVQQEVPVLDADQPPDRAIQFRIGINIGDAIPDGTDLHGDVVNIAARLQAECPPGGICVTRAVRDHVRGRLDFSFGELGALRLKNIAYPVEAFVVRVTTDRAVPSSAALAKIDHLPLPGKPSIAVLAFTNMSGDPQQESFSDGIADDIITELSRSRSLFVIARNSSFTYKGHAVDVKQVSRELGVRYVTEGGVRRIGSRVRVTVQLIDAQTGNHVWAERYDRDVSEVFAVQDEITAAAITAIQPAVAQAEHRRIIRKAPENLGAWEAYQCGVSHITNLNTVDFARAREFLHRAIMLDPAFVAAYIALGFVSLWEGSQFPTRPLREVASETGSWARKALHIDSNDSEALALLATSILFTGDTRVALECASQALYNNPNSFWADDVKGAILADDGRTAEGRNLLQTALRLSPRDPRNVIVLHQIARSYYWESDYENAVGVSVRAVARHAYPPTTYSFLAAALGQLGRLSEAHDALRKAIEASPQAFFLYVRSRPPWFRLEDYEHLLDGLRKAGWQG